MDMVKLSWVVQVGPMNLFYGGKRVVLERRDETKEAEDLDSCTLKIAMS